MKIIAAAFLLLLPGFNALAQDPVTDQLKALTDQKAYERVIAGYAENSKDYSAKALYYIGLAYFVKEDDANCLKFLDLSIAKDPTDPLPHSVKSMAYKYMNNTMEAIQSMKDAIALKPNDPDFYSRLGDIHYDNKNYEPAISAYRKATAIENCPAYPFLMVGQSYLNWGNQQKALEEYYRAKDNIAKNTEEHRKAVLNVGLLETARGNYAKARQVYEESLQSDPRDYHALGNLIQVLYHEKLYEQARAAKDKLYAAHKNGETQTSFKEMFCFDRFTWNDKKIEAYERFEDGSENSRYDKHIFFVVNAKDEVDFTVQTEYAKVKHEAGGPKFTLGRSKDQMHSIYSLGINDDFSYEDLKKMVLDILDEKIKPLTSVPEEN